MKTASGATAVQIVEKRHGIRTILEHLGSAHDEAELAALMQAGRENIQPPAPVVRRDDPARDHRPIGLEQLLDRYQAELIKSAERGQVRAVEGSVGHVEVFQMDRCREPPSSEDLGTYPETATPTRLTPDLHPRL